MKEDGTINDYGTLHKSNGRYALRIKRFSPLDVEDVFLAITNPSTFRQWYHFATREMDLKFGGKIAFDDGEGTTYEATITS